jgi:hypothetical protein
MAALVIGVALSPRALGYSYNWHAYSQSGNSGGQSSNSGVAQALRSAHALLVQADHDYDGHRAKAAEEVHKALAELGHHHHRCSTTSSTHATTASAAHSAKTHEVQTASDSQLRKAQQILNSVAGRIHNHPGAQRNVTAAVAEINKALTIR